MLYKANPIYIENTIKKQKGVAESILMKLKSLGFTAVVAGGAPRDWFLGKIASDLDFFVDNASSCGKEFDVFDFCDQLDVECKEIEPTGVYELNKRLDSVVEFKFNNVSCQIITLKSDQEDDYVSSDQIHSTFPANVGKVSYKQNSNGDFVIEGTEEFYFAHKYKILDFEPSKLYNKYYKTKIRKKFKDYALVLRRPSPKLHMSLS